MDWDDAPCGLLSLLPDGWIDQVNPTFLQWTGYRREELVGRRPFRDLLAGGGRIFYETHLAPLLLLQGSAREIAVDILCADGRRMPALLNASRRQAEAGHPRCITIALFDATQRRGYENELLRERQRAEQADRVKADFISMVSHEIRSPLSGIFGIAQLLDMSAPLTHGQRELIQLLRRSCDNLLDLINEILDFSKVESGVATLEERSFDLRHLISGVT